MRDFLDGFVLWKEHVGSSNRKTASGGKMMAVARGSGAPHNLPARAQKQQARKQVPTVPFHSWRAEKRNRNPLSYRTRREACTDPAKRAACSAHTGEASLAELNCIKDYFSLQYPLK